MDATVQYLTGTSFPGDVVETYMCMSVFGELSVPFEKTSLAEINVSFSLVGLSRAENPFHPDCFPSFLWTSSGLQSKYFELIFDIS